MNVAVVDIGSNSTRLLIAERSGGALTELVRRSEVTRLGAGVDSEGRLAADAMERVYAVLDGYRGQIADHHCESAVAVLTSAVRDSANGERFAAQIEERYGIEPHILSGSQEAQLTYRGATGDRDPADRTPTLVLDIGGGSTEMVIGEGADLRVHVSTQAGVVRQTERHLHHDPPTAAELTAVVEDAAAILSAAVPEPERVRVRAGIAVAGTATSLAAIAQSLEPYDPDRVEGYRVTRGECDDILARLSAMALPERRQVAGLHPDRAPTIVAGVLIFREALRLFGLGEIEVSEHDILRGAARQLTRHSDK